MDRIVCWLSAEARDDAVDESVVVLAQVQPRQQDLAFAA